jgi:AcrR family transcriptional regulator
MVNKNQKQRRPSARVALKRAQTRRDILDAAQSILHDGGVDAVTLASVAGQLGMTKQALYYYFASKEVLVRALVTTLLDEEIETLIAAIDGLDSNERLLGTLINAFHGHYTDRMDAFRTVYCQSQLYASPDSAIDELTLRDEIHPRTRHLFDVLEERLVGSGASNEHRTHMRQLAFSAWASALGLLTILGVADSTSDPLAHADKDLLDTLSMVFDDAVASAGTKPHQVRS